MFFSRHQRRKIKAPKSDLANLAQFAISAKSDLAISAIFY